MAEATGTCRFCGQQILLKDGGEMTQPQREEAATMSCDCDDALKYQEIAERVEKAKGRVRELFGDGAKGSKVDENMLDMMCAAVDMISNKQIKQFQITIRTGLKCKIMQMAKDKIKVVREMSSNDTFEQ